MQNKNPPEQQLNIFGEPIKICSNNPITGFFRDGCCNTDLTDSGSHTVCAEMTTEFLTFSKLNGNDLSTPRPEFGFEGLKDGDRWCLCAGRWLEAAKEGKAPLIAGESTHQASLTIIPEASLMKHLIKLN
jgi:uncharacterized protein (DUF2237 family)